MRNSSKNLGVSRVVFTGRKSRKWINTQIKFRVLIAILITVGICSQTSQARTIVVTETDDALLANSANDGRCTLREAINSIRQGTDQPMENGGGPFVTGCNTFGAPFGTNDRIEFSDSLDGQTVSYRVGPNGFGLTADMEFNREARDITLDANGISRGFVVFGAEVIFNNVTLTGGDARNAPGATGGSLFVEQGSTVTLNNSTITGNTAEFAGGFFARGAGTLVRLNNSELTSNVAEGTAGGFTANGGARVEVLNSTISSNTAANLSGAFFAVGSGTQIQIESSTLSANSANDTAVFTVRDSASLTIENSTISGNQATTFNAIGFIGTSGIIDSPPTSVTVRSSTIFNNTTTSGNFAGLGISGNSLVNFQNSILAGSTFSDCFVASGSGASLVSDASSIIQNPNTGTNSCASNARTGIDPNLEPLGDNGGPTMTHALGSGSPALSSGRSCLATDQRGELRPPNGCDVGSFEGEDEASFFIMPIPGRGAVIFPL